MATVANAADFYSISQWAPIGQRLAMPGNGAILGRAINTLILFDELAQLTLVAATR
jgi:hypothetical protein